MIIADIVAKISIILVINSILKFFFLYILINPNQSPTNFNSIYDKNKILPINNSMIGLIGLITKIKKII
ncbi:hypothetical protein GCM10008921_22080 [Metaclostridioides mangenotii]